MALSIRVKTRIKIVLGLAIVGMAISIGYDLIASNARGYNYTFVFLLASIY